MATFNSLIPELSAWLASENVEKDENGVKQYVQHNESISGPECEIAESLGNENANVLEQDVGLDDHIEYAVEDKSSIVELYILLDEVIWRRRMLHTNMCLMNFSMVISH